MRLDDCYSISKGYTVAYDRFRFLFVLRTTEHGVRWTSAYGRMRVNELRCRMYVIQNKTRANEKSRVTRNVEDELKKNTGKHMGHDKGE